MCFSHARSIFRVGLGMCVFYLNLFGLFSGILCEKVTRNLRNDMFLKRRFK